MAPSQFNLGTFAKPVIAQCAIPAQEDTSSETATEAARKRKYSREFAADAMGRQCTSEKFALMTHLSACGDARNAIQCAPTKKT